MFLDAAYESKQNETEGKGLKILPPKQMLQRLPIALAQLKTGNNSDAIMQMQCINNGRYIYEFRKQWNF